MITERGDLDVLLKKFKDWTKPKTNTLDVAFRQWQQESLTLPEYIDKTTILCDQCEYFIEAQDRLLSEAIEIRLCSREACYKWIEKGLSITPEEAIVITQNEEATGSSGINRRNALIPRNKDSSRGRP